MEIVLKKEVLLKSLQLVSSLAIKNDQYPVLSNLLFYGEKDHLYVTGSDLEIELIRRITLKGAGLNKFSFTVPAKKILDIWRSFSNESVIYLTIKDDKVTISSGACKFELLCMDAGLFPKIEPNINDCEFKIKKTVLKILLEKTQFSMANQDVRYYLNGMLFRFLANELVVVATNGHRLAVSKITNANHIENKKDILVPRKAIAELLKLLNDSSDDYFLDLSLDKNHLFIKGNDFEFSVKLIQGNFPNYHSVFPIENKKKLLVDVDLLKQALSRVSILSNEKHKGIRFYISTNKLLIVANNPEQERAEEVIPIQFEGESVTISFNSLYLLDILNVLDSGVLTVIFTHESGSVLFMQEATQQNVQSKYIVMPLKI